MKIDYKKLMMLFVPVLPMLFAGCQVGDMFGGNNAGGDVWLDEGEVSGPTVTLRTVKGNFVIDVEIADTTAERTKGLMYRNEMKDNHGMFFVFENEEELSFWMKNTLIPLDMIFLNSDYKVVHVQKGAEPCKKDPCEVFPSNQPAKYVLEVKAGTSDRLEVKAGDTAEVKI